MVFEKICKLLADFKDLDTTEITMQTSMEELGLDSLDTVELVMQLEEEFAITVETNDEIRTVGDIVTAIEVLIK